jgi:hypothetical protein
MVVTQWSSTYTILQSHPSSTNLNLRSVGPRQWCSCPDLCTDIGIPTRSRVCLEVNTHTGTLDYFINNKHIENRVVNVPKDVYFGVWYFIYYLSLCIDIKIQNNNYCNVYFYFISFLPMSLLIVTLCYLFQHYQHQHLLI